MRGIKRSSVRTDRQKKVTKVTKVTKVRNHRGKPSLFAQVIFSFELHVFSLDPFNMNRFFLPPATGPGTLTQH